MSVKAEKDGHAIERTLTHTYTFGCYENKPNAMKRKTNMKLRKEGHSIHDKKKGKEKQKGVGNEKQF